MATENATLEEIAGLVTSEADAFDPDDNSIDLDDELSPTVGDDDDIDEDDDLEEIDGDDDYDDDPDDDPDADDEVDGAFVLDADDDSLVEVVIDGEVQLRSLTDLKQAMSGEGAIDKRLYEATEMRKAAVAERSEWSQQKEAQSEALVAVASHFSGMVLAPRYRAPDPALQAKDPQKYLMQQNAFDRDQKRIEETRNQLTGMFGGLVQQHEHDKEQRRQSEIQKAVSQLPALLDPELGPKRRQQYVDTAEHYGFSIDEIAKAGDSRLYLMAYDAMLYRLSKQKGANKEVQTGKRKRSPPRAMRSGNTTAKVRAKQSAKRATAAKSRAAESGRVDDIAAFITNSR